MVQCFVKRDFVPVFSENQIPKLLYVSKIDASYSVHPRVMHCHHDRVEILFVRSGTGIYIVDEKRYQIQKGDIIICNSGVLHDEMPEQNRDLNTYCCAFSNLHLDGLQPNCLIKSGIKPIFSSDNQCDTVENLMRMMYSILSSGAPEAENTCHYLMIALMTIVLRLIEENQAVESMENSEIQILGERIKQYIDARYYEDLNLQSISRSLHLSPYYLSHVFKKATGYSPMQYIMRRRIGEAQTLLISSTDSITQIAAMVGYGNPNYFNVIFTKYIGMSPSLYRKTYTTFFEEDKS